jgi:cholesterol transport system auxiliary component
LYLLRKIWIPAIALAFAGTACSTLKQPSQKIDFYTPEYSPPKAGDLKPLSATLRVQRFTVAPLYNTNQMIYRDRSFRREAYVYDRWRSNPGDLVTYFFSRDLRESGLFRAVSPWETELRTGYVLEGSVEEFFEWETEEAWKAVLAVSLTLLAEGEPDISKKVLFQKTLSSSKPCKQKNPVGFAEAMSEAMAEVSREIIKSIYHRLANRE